MINLERPPQEEPSTNWFAWSDWFFRLYEYVRGFFLPIFTSTDRGSAGNKGRIIFNETEGAMQLDNGTEWSSVTTLATSGFKQLVTFTSSGSYTPSAGVTKVKTIVVGAGGGGGATETTGTGEGASSAGGGGGATAIAWLNVSDLDPVTAITVGTGGSTGVGGTTGGTGSSGGDSSFGSTIIAGGGNGGAEGNDTSGTTHEVGGTGGAATGGDINLRGGTGGFGLVVSGTIVRSGYGGANHFVGQQRMSSSSTIDGSTGYFPGGGGTGQAIASSNTGRPGGVGANGVVWIEEYYS